MAQQIKNDRDLKAHKNTQDCRWAEAITSAKLVGLLFTVILLISAIAVAICFLGMVVLDYYAVVKADPKKLEGFCGWLLSHSVTLLLGAVPPIVYIKSKR